MVWFKVLLEVSWFLSLKLLFIENKHFPDRSEMNRIFEQPKIENNLRSNCKNKLELNISMFS